jgi:Putative Flp pilus-assembly TadE/G-like
MTRSSETQPTTHWSRGDNRRGERGISLGLVAISIFALFGVSALLIDVVTLYVARADAQRVANAAALAGAKALVDQGVTADPTNAAGKWGSACLLAANAAHQIISTNKIGGAAVPAGETVCFGSHVVLPCGATCPSSGSAGSGFGVNPQIGVTLRSATLPLFFSKILGQASATVSAGGVAEGFNSSGTSVPVASRGVMPWLIPNIDPKNGVTIIDSGSGQMSMPGPAGIIGEQITLNMGCVAGGCGTLTAPNPVAGPPTNKSTFYPTALANAPTTAPSCSVAGTAYQMNLVASNPTPIACGALATVETTVIPATPANQTELSCRIRANPGNGQDRISSTYPFSITTDDNNPLVLNGTVTEGDAISTSPSVVTIPIYDAGASGGLYLAPVSPVIIGFVQAFVKSTTAGSPTIQVMNVSGCGTTARGVSTAVGSDGARAVPVRLIHP